MYSSMAQRYRELKNVVADCRLSDDALFSLLFWKDAGATAGIDTSSPSDRLSWGQALDWTWKSADAKPTGAAGGREHTHFPY